LTSLASHSGERSTAWAESWRRGKARRPRQRQSRQTGVPRRDDAPGQHQPPGQVPPGPPNLFADRQGLANQQDHREQGCSGTHRAGSGAPWLGSGFSHARQTAAADRTASCCTRSTSSEAAGGSRSDHRARRVARAFRGHRIVPARPPAINPQAHPAIRNCPETPRRRL